LTLQNFSSFKNTGFSILTCGMRGATLSQDNNTIEGGSYQINNMQAGVFQPASIQAAKAKKQRAAQAAKAETQRKQWERMTPKQKKEYLARQRAQENANRQATEDLLKTIFGGSSEPSTSGQDRDHERWNRDQQDRDRARQAERDRQPAPAPVTPVGGSCGLYGNGPCH
jgi:hypothetical protein